MCVMKHYFDYEADLSDESSLIYVDANRLTKFLNDFDIIQDKMLRKYKDYNRKAKNFIQEVLKNDIIQELAKSKKQKLKPIIKNK